MRQALCALHLMNVATAVCPALSLRSFGLTHIIATLISVKAALSHALSILKLKIECNSSYVHHFRFVFQLVKKKKVF